MKHLIYVICTLLALRIAGAQIDGGLARDYFNEAKALSQADNGNLWGVKLYGPMMFFDPQSRICIANMPDGEGKLKAKDGLYIGTLPAEIPAANTALQWAGIHWTMMIWPLPNGKYARNRLVMHECFHRVQDGLGYPAFSPANAHFDTLDGRIWSQLELRALAEALLHEDSSGRQSAQDALLFRKYRQSIFPKAESEENALEMNEGLAEYSGYRLCGLPLSTLPPRVAQRLEDSGSSSASRSFAYLTGPAYGLLLDRYEPKWRERLSHTKSLAALLTKALELRTPVSLKAAAQDRVATYQGDRLIAFEQSREAKRVERVARYRKALVEGPIVELPLSAGVAYSYDPNAVETIGENETVYMTLRITDLWGTLEVSSMALMIRDKGNLASVKVSAIGKTDGDTVKGDGWTLRLNTAWTLIKGSRPEDWTVRKV